MPVPLFQSPLAFLNRILDRVALKFLPGLVRPQGVSSTLTFLRKESCYLLAIEAVWMYATLKIPAARDPPTGGRQPCELHLQRQIWDGNSE